MTANAYRQEIKNLMSPAQALLLEQRISAVLQPDAYSGSDGDYHIRSIYFDTPDNKSYEEKLSGICEREKIRIRLYNLNTDTIKLERKEKRENLIYKDVMNIRKETAEEMVQGNFEGLLTYQHPLAKDIYAKATSERLKAVVVVDYHRRAYTYPAGNVRITFDSVLQSRCVDDTVWEPGALYNVLDNQTILEIKFNKFLPEHIRQLLYSVPGQRMALSKYTLCRENLRHKQGDFIGGK